jgi:hypothetical protein
MLARPSFGANGQERVKLPRRFSEAHSSLDEEKARRCSAQLHVSLFITAGIRSWAGLAVSR